MKNLKNRHSWKEYQWQIKNDDSQPRRMWIRDDNRIFEVDNNTFQTANATHRYEMFFNTFEEAEVAINNSFSEMDTESRPSGRT